MGVHQNKIAIKVGWVHRLKMVEHPWSRVFSTCSIERCVLEQKSNEQLLECFNGSISLGYLFQVLQVWKCGFALQLTFFSFNFQAEGENSTFSFLNKAFFFFIILIFTFSSLCNFLTFFAAWLIRLMIKGISAMKISSFYLNLVFVSSTT